MVILSYSVIINKYWMLRNGPAHVGDHQLWNEDHRSTIPCAFVIPTDNNTFLIGPVCEQQTNKAKRPMILDHSDQNIPKAKWEGIFFSCWFHSYWTSWTRWSKFEKKFFWSSLSSYQLKLFWNTVVSSEPIKIRWPTAAPSCVKNPTLL